MAENNKARTGLAAGVGGLIGAVTATLFSRKAQAAPSEGEVQLDEAAMSLLLAIAQTGQSIDETTLRIAAALGINVLENPREITAFRILVPVVNTPVQLPDREIPYDIHFVIKAIPTNLGLIYVGNSRHEAQNINSSWWLIANETIEYKIRNSAQLWINATVAGEGVLCTVEQKGRAT